MSEYMNMNPEQYTAKRVLLGVQSQVSYKEKFQN